MDAPRLKSDTVIATAGFFRLNWQTNAKVVELQESADPDYQNAESLYRGQDRATVISGKPNGHWYYRIRTIEPDNPGPWSDTVEVEVAHHGLIRAFTFLGLGLIVFIATIMLIVRGPEERA